MLVQFFTRLASFEKDGMSLRITVAVGIVVSYFIPVDGPSPCLAILKSQQRVWLQVALGFRLKRVIDKFAFIQNSG
jgi:hypothetical protein